MAQCPPERREELLRKMPWLKATERKQRVAAKREQPEQELQIACCRLLRTLPGTLFWATPNHMAYRRKEQSEGAYIGFMARQKAMGFLAGVSDLVIIFRNQYGAVTICLPELKIGSNSPSETQQAFADKANSLGCHTDVVRSVDELVALLRSAGHPSFKS